MSEASPTPRRGAGESDSRSVVGRGEGRAHSRPFKLHSVTTQTIHLRLQASTSTSIAWGFPVRLIYPQLPPDPIELDLFHFDKQLFVPLPLASRYTSERGGRLVLPSKSHARSPPPQECAWMSSTRCVTYTGTIIDSGVHPCMANLPRHYFSC